MKILEEKLWQWWVNTDDPWLSMPEEEEVGWDKCLMDCIYPGSHKVLKGSTERKGLQ